MWHGQNKGKTTIITKYTIITNYNNKGETTIPTTTKNQNAFYCNNKLILKSGKKAVNDILPFTYHITDGL